MKYKTCVSIAEKNPKKINTILRNALSKSEYAEIRLDFVKPSEVPTVLESIKKKYLGVFAHYDQKMKVENSLVQKRKEFRF